MNPVYDKDVYNEYFEYNLKYARVYFDFGSGFSEADSVIVPMQNKGKHYLLGLKLNLEVQSVRIDPIEHEYIRFRNYSFKIDNQKIGRINTACGKISAWRVEKNIIARSMFYCKYE